jgi:hypothetical protein
MKHLKTFQNFLSESKVNEALQDTKFSQETVQLLWRFILDAAAASVNTKDNATLSFSSAGQAGKVQNPQNAFWSEILNNSKNWEIGQISATSSEILIAITEGNIVKGYLTLNYDTPKQSFSKKSDSYLTAIPKIQDFSRSRQFKKIVY